MVFKFLIQLEWVDEPEVWRSVEVPAEFTFEQFHDVIHTIFGWGHFHLWDFEPNRKSSRALPDFCIQPCAGEAYWDGVPRMSAERTKLDRIFTTKKQLIYTYDFGDNWKHLIKLTGRIDEDREYTVCTGGRGTTPPEDCGGFSGYMNIKEAFAEKNEAKMADYREWLGLDEDQCWDPDSFGPADIEEINLALQKIKLQPHKEEKEEKPKNGRNDPCPCGSGKKYKHCCGRNKLATAPPENSRLIWVSRLYLATARLISISPDKSG